MVNVDVRFGSVSDHDTSPFNCQERVMEANQCSQRVPWNKGKIVGQKAPLKLKEVRAVRIRLQLAERVRDLALFDLGSLLLH